MTQSQPRRPRVFMMDLFATVPYYTAYLAKALLAQPIDLTVGSISYYLDPSCFAGRGIKLDPGLFDVVGRFQLPRLPRRILKMAEGTLNLLALTVRFLVSPPEIVHVQFLTLVTSRIPLDLWLVKLCRRRGSKIVLTVHDLLPHDTGLTHRQVFHKLYHSADRIICHSDAIKIRLVNEFSLADSHICVIPHGPFFYDLPANKSDTALPAFATGPEKLLVLWQGIILPYKGVDLLLEAWKHIEAAGADARLLIVGTGATGLVNAIYQQIGHLNLRHVSFHPHFISSEQLVDVYRSADIVVYPYRTITTSGALATGLALGKTIVASDLPVFRELLKDRENSLLVAPQDTAALSTALLELAQDPHLRQQLAERVREMNFGDSSWLLIAEQTARCYQSALNLRP